METKQKTEQATTPGDEALAKECEALRKLIVPVRGGSK